jgi:MFS family permease
LQNFFSFPGLFTKYFFLLLFFQGIVLATASSGLTAQGLFWMLCIARGVTGVGVGGEYPCCSTATNESAEESGRSRGFWLVICGNFVIE